MSAIVLSREDGFRVISLLDLLNMHLESSIMSEEIAGDGELMRSTGRENAEAHMKDRRLRRVSENLLIKLCAQIEAPEARIASRAHFNMAALRFHCVADVEADTHETLYNRLVDLTWQLACGFGSISLRAEEYEVHAELEDRLG